MATLMPLPNGSASAVERTIACPSWLSLPRVESESEDAASGHAKHAFIAAVLAGTSVDAALAQVEDDDDRETCRRLDWRALLGDLDELESEAAFAIDVRARTARRLGHNLGRDYEGTAKRLGKKIGAWEIVGSVDLLGRRKVGRVRVVRDAKSGWQDVTHAADNGQLKFFAAALYLLEGETEIEASLAKIKPDGSVLYLRDGGRAVFTPLELDAFLDELEEAVAAGKEARALVRKRRLPTVSLGAWCRYCEAKNACPGQMRLARSMIPELAAIAERVETMTVEQRGRAWALAYGQARPLLDTVLAALKESIIRDGAVPIGEGRVAKAISYPQERLVASAALELARSLGASQDQLDECYREHTVTKVIEANAPRLKRGRAA